MFGMLLSHYESHCNIHTEMAYEQIITVQDEMFQCSKTGLYNNAGKALEASENRTGQK